MINRRLHYTFKRFLKIFINCLYCAVGVALCVGLLAIFNAYPIVLYCFIGVVTIAGVFVYCYIKADDDILQETLRKQQLERELKETR